MIALLALTASLASAAPAGYPEARSDPRFELFGVVQLLAGAEKRYSGFHRHDIPYTRAAEAWFKPFIRHPVVEVYERLAGRGVDHLFFNELVFNLGDLPALEPRKPFELGNLRGAGDAEAVEELRLLLADFARVSRFEAFYRETAPLRASMIEEVARQAVKLDAKRRLERYTGMPVRQAYTLIVSPFAEPVLGTTWVRDEGNVRRVTSLYGPEERSGRIEFRLHTRLGGLWTEILGDQLNAAARPHQARLGRSKALFAPVARSCAESWHACVNRHAAFAAAARMLDLSGEHESAREWPVKYARIGLPYIGALAERLREFESDRARYPTLVDFYPRLAEELETLAPAAIPFQGGIRAVLDDPGARAVILPGAETPAVAEAIRALVRRRWKGALVLTDEEALAADLKGRTLIVLGTLAGNRWLGRRFRELQLPLSLGSSGIDFDARPGETSRLSFEGKLGLISTAVNPADASRGLLLYTAVEPELLLSVIAAYDGPADFVVLDGGAAVKTGSYEKTRLPWRLQ